MISYDEYKKVEIKIGHIIAVEPVAKSEKLLRLTVDFGEESPRQVVSGIAAYFPGIQTLVGIKCPFVTNLEPRQLMGLESQAMILAASTDTQFTLLRSSDDIPPGTLVK